MTVECDIWEVAGGLRCKFCIPLGADDLKAKS